MSPTLLAAGYINVDITAVVDELPEVGGRVTARSISRSPGGMTANMACAASRLGLRTLFFGNVGRGSEGDSVLGELEHFGVDTNSIERTASSTTTALILLKPDGERTIVSEPMIFHYELLKSAIETSEGPDCLHVDGYRLPESLDILRKAREAGLYTSADLDGIEATVFADSFAEIAAALDVVFLNRSLAGVVAPAPRTAAERLLECGAGIVAVTLGEEGALVAENWSMDVFSPPPVEVRDTTGAGDVFAGAFLADWLGGNDIGHAGKFAVTASCISVGGQGARGHLPDTKEVERMLDLVGNEANK